MLQERRVELRGHRLHRLPSAPLHQTLHHHANFASETIEPILRVARREERGHERGELRGELRLRQSHRGHLDETERRLHNLAVATLHEREHRGKKLRDRRHERGGELVQQSGERHHRRGLHRGRRADDASEHSHEKFAHAGAHLIARVPARVHRVVVRIRTRGRLERAVNRIIVVTRGEPRAEHAAPAARAAGDPSRAPDLPARRSMARGMSTRSLNACCRVRAFASFVATMSSPRSTANEPCALIAAPSSASEGASASFAASRSISEGRMAATHLRRYRRAAGAHDPEPSTSASSAASRLFASQSVAPSAPD